MLYFPMAIVKYCRNPESFYDENILIDKKISMYRWNLLQNKKFTKIHPF